ncbi:MAG: triple tyrosine motif-containing protein, partial [Flavobacteriaceae bacterium]|nr:triple tyrosine motif-containing protein [Flavobacteriaceae bacterium]
MSSSAGKIVHYGINGSNISEDKQGNIYIGNLDSGLYTIKKGMDKAQKIQSGDSSNTDLIRTIYHNDDKLLIGTDGHGLSVYNIAEEKFSQVDFNITSFDFSKAKIHSVTKDESGNLWLGIYQKGLLQIPSKTNSFNYLGFKSLKNNVIGSNAVMSLYKTEDGTLLVGTDGDGLYGIDRKGRQRFHWDKEDNFPPTLMSLFQDSAKQIWLGSFLNNFGRVDLENGRFNEFVLKDENGEKVQNVFSITEDDHKTLWVGTMGSGLFSIDLQTNEVESFFGVQNPDYSMPPNFLHNVWINTVYAGEDDKLWMGTFDGLGTYDVAENSFINSFGTNRLLGGIIIYAIFEEGDYLWLGTSEGLIKYNKQSHEYKKFNTTDGLPNDVVVAITGDAEKNLWISTYHGISKFNPETENFINYFYNDGLQGNEFSKNAVFSNQKNEIYLGGIHGVNYFNPLKIKGKSATPEVRLTGFYIQNENVKKGIKSGDYEIIDKPVINAEEFNLSIEDNSFSMEFATLDFDNPSHITYAYSMDGEDWISLQQGANTVAFNNLKPGTYNFKVRAKDYTNFSEPKEITIVIHPAWYFSNAAITGYTILLLAGISVIIVFVRQRRKTRQELREHVKNEQINDAKLQLYSNISHEIRTPITLILNPLKKLLESGADSDKQKLYGIMKRNSERILHLINQLMDVSKISKGEIDLNFRKKDIISYTKETCLIFEDQIHSKDIDFRILHEPDSLYVSIDPK